VDPKYTADPTGLVFGMGDIRFVENPYVRSLRMPIGKTVVEQVTGDR
jgi:hypothetical protein